MRIAVYTQGGKYLTHSQLEELIELSSKYGVEFTFNREFADYANNSLGFNINWFDNAEQMASESEILISYGGDGTFLKSIAMRGSRSIPIMGIGSGRLGFLASVPSQDVETAIAAVVLGNYTIEQRTMIHAEGEMFDGNISSDAFNEFTIQKKGVNIVGIEVNIDGYYAATYMADGLIISTPSGSTAYSMSVGGPIVSPSCDCFIINPIASHNLTMRPLVVSGSSEITLKIHSRTESATATLDNRSFLIANQSEFKITKSKDIVRLVKLDGNSFYETLRKKLMWGVESRPTL